MNKYLLPAVTLVLMLVAGVYFVFRGDTSEQANMDYSLISGEKITHSDLKGKVSLIKFWATTCTTCVAQMPDDIKYYEKYSPQGFEVVAVAMKYDNLDAIKNFASDRKLPFKVAYDQDGSLAKSYGGVRFTPVMFLLDRKGEVVKSFAGKYNHEDFIKTLEDTLKNS
ncbi:TlpA disulfide reductase family protein [Taylorella equigenitalis]|uniref:Redoxin domain protein n=3 Tax=Taylorella equigenitalis TaxID=29575 RepID=A0A654KH72_TAYEM|nr:TlpA disulfide reductase family protein [Taylorella equigenitalis]ADU91781.1 Redoxin domain protein [Taylorella equigenitalis MCE9]AFN35346.1 putative thioredoxin [Taylorella equigenitalis ATCC 35865]ASY37312.1 TlpA family protein disulfide reductase [Taylorella equigenitalis]ASY38778.1 thioredoxin [Taylorella equigenitalis]ASY40301.1 thioredoxin [Taylorella equigenitalis]